MSSVLAGLKIVFSFLVNYSEKKNTCIQEITQVFFSYFRTDMKYFSLFSGVGGFEKGIEQSFRHQGRRTVQGEEREHDGGTELHDKGYREQAVCVGFSEIDKYATHIYKKHFPTHHEYGDITKINPAELPDFELLVGGFPCQAFSVAGKRRGFDDTRGTLFFEIARIAREKQPRLLLLENVKGLLSHDKGSTFLTIISTLDELGYDCQWQVLNSKNHRVPQNRERVYIIGHLRGTPRPEVFPLGGTDEEDTRKLEYAGQVGEADWAGDGKNLSRNAREGYRVYKDSGLSPALRSQLGGASRGSQIIQINQPKHSNDRVYGTDGVSPTLNTMQGGRRQPFVSIKYGQNNPDRNGNTDKNMFTLKAGGSNAGVTDGAKIRRLTPTECERLQGFPDGWTEGISSTQRYKCLGNAVTVNVVEAIARKLFS